MIDIVLGRCTLQHISKIMTIFHQAQQCFSNKIKPLHVAQNTTNLRPHTQEQTQ
jgi:hypothetical protein